jgi:capsule polysaccharide export protein KpsE/RkpR
MEKALDKLEKRFSVVLTPEGFFVISVQGSTREEAASMVMDVISYANEELSHLVTSRARRGRIEAEATLAEAADSLEAAQIRMEAFRARSGLSFPEEQGAAAVLVFQTLETELALAEAELAGYAGGVSYRNPAYAQVLQRIDYLRGILQNRLNEGDTLSVFPGMSLFPSYIREYEQLYQELETRRAIYLLIRQELEMLRLDEVRESPTIEIVVPPSPEFLRVYPKRGRTVLLFTFIAFLLAILWIALLTYFRRLMADERTGPFWREVMDGSKRQLSLRRRR